MKIGIIGAGNMGGAIARGVLGNDPQRHYEVVISNHSRGKLEALKQEFPRVVIAESNKDVAREADIVIFAVKPWIMPDVIEEVRETVSPDKLLVSIAGGMSLEDFEDILCRAEKFPLFHVIPDTAISVGKGMTFVSSWHASEAQVEAVMAIFGLLGEVALTDEDHMNAATALSSCGIAYIYKYIQASVQAGVQMGFRPADALRYTLATMDGACEMLRANGTLPQQEIDRVTTPGGMTIRGINELEHAGFTSAVIKAILTPLHK